MSIISPPQMSREPRAHLRTKQEPRTALQNAGLFSVSLQRRWAANAEEEEERNRGAELPHPYKGPSDPAETLHPHYKFLPGLPRGSVVKHLPAIAGDMCASLYLRRSQMPQSSRDCAPQLLNLCSGPKSCNYDPRHQGY